MSDRATDVPTKPKTSKNFKDLTPQERERIDFLRIMLVVCLVFLHFGAIHGSPVPSTVGYAGQDYPVASIIVSFIGFIGYTAVPALSVISGFLFFRGADRHITPDFRRLVLRRFKSLALPLLIWSTSFVLLGFALFVVSGDYYSDIFAPADGDLFRSISNAWLGLRDFPLAIQLWFVRDLLVTILVSPIIWFLVSRAPILTLIALLAIWLSGHTLWIFLKLDVVGFFCVGAAFAMHGWRRELPPKLVPWLLVAFPILVMARTVAPVWLENPEAHHGLFMATCLMRIVGVLAIWSAAPLLMVPFVSVLTARFSYLAFFIHCAHYPPIFFIKKFLGAKLGPSSDLEHLLLYGVTVAITLVGVGLAALAMRAVAPGLFSILSGGRTVPATPELSRAAV